MTRVAIVGLGAVTRNIHLPAYARLNGKVAIVAGCDPDAGARGRSGLPATFADAAEMIERSRPDVVVVCTPPALHRAQTLLALEAGCHVFLEKPLAEADEIIHAADRARRTVVINSQFPCMHSKTGKLLWRTQTGGDIHASPISYASHGRQFVACSMGGILMSFALPEQSPR
jgi:predicted dehydrogenase